MFTVKIKKHRENGTKTEFHYCDSFESFTDLGNQKNLYIFMCYNNKTLEGYRKEVSIGDRMDCENVAHRVEIYNIKGHLVDRACWNVSY